MDRSSARTSSLPSIRVRPSLRTRQRRCVPDPDGPLRIRRREATTVGAKPRGEDALRVTVERVEIEPGLNVPDLDRPVAPGRGEATTVGAEGDGADRRRVPE